MPIALELVRDLDLVDGHTFAGRHPQPAVVFTGSAGGDGPLRVDTPDQPIFTGAGLPTIVPELGASTDVLVAVETSLATGVALEALQPDARIEWLQKTGRNPFGALITLGRSPNNDIIVDTPTVSKVHAIFTHTPTGWLLSDSNSSNGTFVDGIRLPAGEKRPIDDGAELRLGRDVRALLLFPESLVTVLEGLRRRQRRR